MNDVAKWFMLSAVVFVLAGMVWGIQMSASGDHLLSPAHGHLNLIGYVSMALFSVYYAITPSAAQSGLAKAHFGLAVVTVVLLVPGIAMAINGSGEVLAQVSSILAVLVMVLFGVVVLRHGVGHAVNS